MPENKDKCPKCSYDWEAHEFAITKQKRVEGNG